MTVGVESLVVIVGACGAGALAWRSRRGDFYKAVAEEKTAENAQLREENHRLHEMTDITPILKTLDHVSRTLERTAAALDGVVAKVGEMNGSLRSHSTAMQALADRLIVDEAARGLLSEAGRERGQP